MSTQKQRAAERTEKQFGAKAEWIRRQPCVVCKRSPCEAAHARPRSRGGTAEHLVPLCSEHHHEQHAAGIYTFESHHGVSLAFLAGHFDFKWHHRDGDLD